MPAQKLEEIFHFFQAKPIAKDEFSDFYVNADKGRGGNPVFNALKRRIVSQPVGGENWHDVHPIVKDILEERGLLHS